MASPRRSRYKITDAVIDLMNGDLQQLREQVKVNPAAITAARPRRYVAALIDVPESIIERWLVASTQPRATDDLACFAEVFMRYVDVFAGRYERNIANIANDPTNRNALQANLKVLEWIADEQRALAEGPQEVAGLPADLAEHLTDEEYATLLAREEDRLRREQEDRDLLDRLTARKAQQRLGG
jgi:hypothetical protein